VLGRREDAEGDRVVPALATPQTDERETMGMKISSLTDALRDRLNLGDNAKGVVVLEIDEGSGAFENGIRQGDLIAEVGQKPVTSAKGVTDALQAARDAGRKSVLLLVRRAGDPRFVALSLDG
ncbi:MAG: PDZ domain-containing protein, partial [Pseudomonadota bacterium]